MSINLFCRRKGWCRLHIYVSKEKEYSLTGSAGSPEREGRCLVLGTGIQFCEIVKPQALRSRFVLQAWLTSSQTFNQQRLPSLPPWTVSTQITHEKGTSVLGMFLFWGFSFLVVSLVLAAPGDDRPIWGGGGASTNKEKDTNLDIRTSGQDTDDTFGLRAGLVNRWEILGS